MRNVRSISMAAAVLIAAMPVAVAAEANQHTTRSNQSADAAPADEVIPGESGDQQQRSSKKGYDYYQSQSDMAAQTEGSANTMPGQEVAAMDKAPDLGPDADEASRANINTSRSNTKGQ